MPEYGAIALSHALDGEHFVEHAATNGYGATFIEQQNGARNDGVGLQYRPSVEQMTQRRPACSPSRFVPSAAAPPQAALWRAVRKAAWAPRRARAGTHRRGRRLPPPPRGVENLCRWRGAWPPPRSTRRKPKSKGGLGSAARVALPLRDRESSSFFFKKKNKLNKNGSRIPESSFQPGPYDGPSPTRPQRPDLPIFFFIFALPLWLDFSS